MRKDNQLESISQSDLKLMNDLNSALQQQKHRGHFIVVFLLLVLIVVFVVWAYNSSLEEVTRGQGTIISSSHEQIIQSLDPGVIVAMHVKEGDIVEKDQVLLELDDTRSSAMLRETEAKVDNLTAIAARLKAETTGTQPVFPKTLSAELKQREQTAFVARRRAMTDAVAGLQNSKQYLDREIAITRPLAQQGLVSNVEVLRMERQSADLGLQISERQNRYATDANNELVKTEAELAQAVEMVVMRADPVEGSDIRAPLRGIVKNIKINTVGGVVNAGQEIMEIIPIDDKLLVEAYIRPQDVAFLRPGLPAVVKVSAYDYGIYGGLEGKVTLISPDTLSNDKRNSELKLNQNDVYYRILVQTDESSLLDKNGQKMPIIPGMVATVDIKTGEKSVFQYLTKPITRMKQAMQER
ncbi:adhesin transport system membrane fusion protein [Acinetobacter calcoaceticus]|uniref:Membrane fusion protein (MFP) family protein n=1 Tax=Acinetobacter calcoaceticus TaxID=471 RepID=A0A4R1XT28_ACICA|nr:adhesin transport system membrane fusion protein [Acinetobacter calcoaceticus]